MEHTLQHPFFTKDKDCIFPSHMPDMMYQNDSVEIDKQTLSVMRVLLRSQSEETIRAALKSKGSVIKWVKWHTEVERLTHTCEFRSNVEQKVFMMLNQPAKDQVIGGKDYSFLKKEIILYSKPIQTAERMILTHCVPLEVLDLKSPASALSSSSTLCDNTAALKKTTDAPDKGFVKTTSDVLEDGLVITFNSHDTSRATSPDGAKLIHLSCQEKENRCDLDTFGHAYSVDTNPLNHLSFSAYSHHSPNCTALHCG
jgi:hypothetical protein